VAKLVSTAILALVCLFDLSWRHDAQAQVLPQFRMTIPASDTQALEVEVTADNYKKPKILYRKDSNSPWAPPTDGLPLASQYAIFSFPISTIPNSAELKSCAIRLVVSEAVPPANTSTLLQLFSEAAQSYKTVASVKVPPETVKGSSIVLSSKSLCEDIKASRNTSSDTARVVRFFLRHEIKNAKVAVFTRNTANDPSVRPRLMLIYSPPNALPGDADWGQLRHDAQRSGRSAWKMYDNGDFTGFKISPLTSQADPNFKPLSLPQSPLLYGGMLVAAKENPYSIVALDQKGNQLPGMQFPGKTLPTKFLAAGPNGLLFDATETSIEADDLRRPVQIQSPVKVAETSKEKKESLIDIPTVASDGSIYIVTSEYVRAYSPPPNARELWQYPTGQVNVAAVTLSEDEGSAYVLFGPSQNTGQNRIVALDAATGDCRWTSSKNINIVRDENERMPTPVAGGQDIYFKNQYPTGNKLYAVKDDEPSETLGNSRVLKPSGGGCDQRMSKEYTAAGPMPLAGRGKEAIYLNQGQLCWARGLEDEVCSDITGCDKGQLKEITLMIGDNSDIPNAMRFYGIDPTSQRLFAMKATYGGGQEPKRLAATCRSAAVQTLGPNLILGPDGTLFNYSNEGKLLAIAPSHAGDTLVLTSQIVGMTKDDCTAGSGPRGENNGTAFLAEKIITDPNLCLPPGTDIILSAAMTIGFRSDFTVKAGARLRAKIGVVQ
jgi:hypothetical protein